MGATGTPSTRAISKVFFTLVVLAGALYLAYLVRETLGLVFIAMFLALALGPAVDFFDRHRIPRGAAILLVYVLIAMTIVGVGLLVVPPVVDQVQGLADDIPSYLDELRENETVREYDEKYDITEKLEEQAQKLPSRLGDAAGALQSVTVGVFTTAIQLVTVLTITFFLLLEGGRIHAFLLSLMKPVQQARARTVSSDIYKAVSGYVAGALTIATLNGVIGYFVMTVLGVPFAVPLAVLSAFLGLIPLVGATIGGVVVALVTLFNDFPSDTIVWVIYLIIYQQVENNLVQPVVYRRTVNVHPLVVIVAILIGASLLGVLGALVAIPIAASIQIIVRDWWRFRQEDQAAAEPGPELPEGGDGGPPAPEPSPA